MTVRKATKEETRRIFGNGLIIFGVKPPKVLRNSSTQTDVAPTKPANEPPSSANTKEGSPDETAS